MNIKYLTILEENPTQVNQQTGFIKNLKSFTDFEISTLENKYNSSNSFPKVLIELLKLAGDYCYVLDYGPKGLIDLQQRARRFLTTNSLSILKPFFAIDGYGGDQFLFVYLDENIADPMVYQAMPYVPDGKNWLDSTDVTLSTLINNTMKTFLSGHNPF